MVVDLSPLIAYWGPRITVTDRRIAEYHSMCFGL
jgi:hypothetical protein